MATNSTPSNLLAILHTAVIYLWTIIGTIIFGLTAILVSFFSKTGNSVHHVARLWGRTILWVSGLRVQVIGLENIDASRSAIYMSNHQSNFDIPVFFSALPIQFRWLAKAELFKIPIFGQGMRGAGYISIDRRDTKSAIRSLGRAAQSVREGTSVLIMSKGSYIIRRQAVRLVVRPPIDARAYTRRTKNDLMESVRAAIQEAMASQPEGGGRA
ncbi:MAG: 1-acyl-sn-glycerol-3-phosphate acyltransferase [Desulfatitalea sp.]|nr:1-acyl-sn-glycerol-3-phosphate acyltransferase [Desulfatitalea sp.]